MVVTNKETAAEALLKKFGEKIKDHGAENTPEETDEDKYSGSGEDNDKDKAMPSSGKDAMVRNARFEIVANCDNILAFIQAVALEPP